MVSSVEIDGMTETLAATRGLATDLRRQVNGELRQAAGDCARALAADLLGAASSSGVPAAPLVASSVRVKSDRLPVVTIGGRRRVGRNGAPAGALLWGTERGPASEPNRFGVPRGDGYWIKPTVAGFRKNRAVTIYRGAVGAILRKHKLV